MKGRLRPHLDLKPSDIFPIKTPAMTSANKASEEIVAAATDDIPTQLVRKRTRYVPIIT